ncbi:haloalkane dehalogenase [Streptacidiphilus sp. MAP12-33]|uniref:haloalkane dehalogenase n=1 Tax=Streptacidiphilus sp. MAP12-33 TaxID=3156266 RepID=UPI003515C887
MSEIAVLDSTMYYLESGSGAPIVFLHGNPSSSHLWRDVLPGIGGGRLLAPDLIGMGRSGKPESAYRFADHARYLDAWFDGLDLDGVVLVGHDWGGALALDWAARHPERVRGLAFFETMVRPLAWEDVSPQARARTETLRGRAGEDLVLDQNALVRQAFTGGVLTALSEEELAPYLAPYAGTRESRRPLLEWARQMPLGGEPAELVARIEAYDAWLAKSEDVPKLLLTFEGSPTLMVNAATAAWCAENVAALETVHLGPAGHHAPEDKPREIAGAISAWADRHCLRRERPAG